VTGQGNKIQYEKTDADLKAVTKVGLGIAVLATVVSLALLPILYALKARQEREDPAPPPIAGFEPGRQAPEPRLQGQPFADWNALKARQESLLTSYGWVDEPAGVARIPIEEAMKMVIQRGLPARPASGETASPSPAAPAVSPAPAGGAHR
jgi:hypothetical protein